MYQVGRAPSSLLSIYLPPPKRAGAYGQGGMGLKVKGQGGVLCGGIKMAGCGLVKWETGT